MSSIDLLFIGLVAIHFTLSLALIGLSPIPLPSYSYSSATLQALTQPVVDVILYDSSKPNLRYNASVKSWANGVNKRMFVLEKTAGLTHEASLKAGDKICIALAGRDPITQQHQLVAEINTPKATQAASLFSEKFGRGAQGQGGAGAGDGGGASGSAGVGSKRKGSGSGSGTADKKRKSSSLGVTQGGLQGSGSNVQGASAGVGTEGGAGAGPGPSSNAAAAAAAHAELRTPVIIPGVIALKTLTNYVRDRVNFLLFSCIDLAQLSYDSMNAFSSLQFSTYHLHTGLHEWPHGAEPPDARGGHPHVQPTEDMGHQGQGLGGR